ncbi:DUF6443 domain-containing protein [Dyadobacter sp. CY323]|uniref:DUF6443 domain-containing protein n=1 Tax=Dyadobacter sp. CY323 TaxID=2907302 RepID=UPI001F3A4C55|nr:DUF6443 domain-containing protein [Dyadobacter sp. CY323]MCE6987851.1 RHS repeat-associated core domain-containing protein [Dyadobacter sp. CY323]
MKYILSLFLILSGIYCLGQTGSKNYILSRNFKQTGASPHDVSKVNIQVQYLDGLGRPLQHVAVGQSPSGSDMVQPIAYDAFGRQTFQFLPYETGSNGAFQAGAVAAQAGFFTANSAGLDATDLARPFSETGFELSALNRPLTQRAAGNKSAVANLSYGVNAGGEVKLYNYTANANILLTINANGDHAAGKLNRIQTTDENGKVSIDFTDMQGRLVCRKAMASANEILATYFVYDDYSQLRAVLQPQYQDNASVADFAFLNEYDNRGRMVAKKLPGFGVVNFVYDNFDRQVMSQDAGQLARGVWGLTKYDALNREAFTGEVTSASSRAAWQASFNASQVHHEDKTAGGIGYSLNNTLPNIAESNALVVSYYDDYTFPKPANLVYLNTYGTNALVSAKNLPTGTRTRMLTAAGMWLTSAHYYDAEYRPIQMVRELHDLGAGAIERVSTNYKYDLAAVVAQEKTEQTVSTGTSVFTKTFEYDHADRLLNVLEKLDHGGKSHAAVTLAQRYNALGELQQKWFHSEDGKNFRRRTTYTNNIRNWLTQGRTHYKTKENEPDSSFYAFGLLYASGGNYTNGNISEIQWSGKAENIYKKGLVFLYDGANRLLTSAGLNNYKETESGISYDKNGNIRSMLRNGIAVDNLTYAYIGNQLSAVTDASGNNTGVKSGINSYSYDANGNVTSDGNRGAVLTYNYLNLPKTVTIAGKTLIYDYDAGGTKHKYVADTLTVKYAGAFEYNQANAFKRLALSEGQAVFRKDTIRFDYYLKDHIGNVRVVFDERGRILQNTDYYPFGLEIDRNAPVQTQAARNGVNRYNFLGKETQVGTGYIDLSRRFYDPAVGRFMQVDPVTESQESQSVYQYGWNNPILLSDPNGAYPDSRDKDGFLIARLVTTAFFDAKHAIINTGARLLGSNIRAGYRVEDGQQVFETQINRQVADNSVTGVAQEAANAIGDAALVAGISSGSVNAGNLLSKTSAESQVVKVGKEIANEVTKGIKTATGSKVTGFTRHGINRVLERGVTPNAILDALKSPLKTGRVATDATGRQSQRFVGQFGEIVINPQTGKIVSANPTSTKRAINLLKKLEQ